jgi:hypothetical protein
MSHAKLTSIAVAASLAISLNAQAQQPNPFQIPVQSSSDVQFQPASASSVLSFVQDDQSPEKKLEGTPQNADELSGPETVKPERPSLPRSSKDTKDATDVAKPTVAQAPIELGELKVPNLSIEDIGTGDVPDDVTTDRLPDPIALPMGPERGVFALNTKEWYQPGFCYQPLYFEDIMLERHGHERYPCLQPFISTAKFFGSVPLAPYKWTLQRPLEDRHSLGNYRPGTPAPLLRQRLPYDPIAIRNQIGASAAAAVAIP